MERDRTRQKVLEWQSQLLAMGAREAGTIRFWIRPQSAADRPASENWEQRRICGSVPEMYIRYDPICDARVEEMDPGTGHPST